MEATTATPANGDIPLSSAAPSSERKPSALEVTGDRLAPKPVEVTSVPETPVNGSTPAGGTPQPELQIPVEPATEKSKTPEASVILGPADETPAEPMADHREPEVMGSSQDDAAATGEKRKLDNGATSAINAASSADSNADKEPIEEVEAEPRPEKKAKVTDKIVEKVAEVKEMLTGGSSSSSSADNGATTSANGNARRPGRPKKDKTAPPAVGRALRKTRSQGPVEESA